MNFLNLNATIKIEYEGWDVTLTFTDSLTPPKYTATNGTEEISGSLDPKEAVSLTSSQNKKPKGFYIPKLFN